LLVVVVFCGGIAEGAAKRMGGYTIIPRSGDSRTSLIFVCALLLLEIDDNLVRMVKWFFASLLPVGGVAVEAMGAGDKLGDGALAGIR